ncbi:MAG: hypothetical protein KGO51_02315 [Alphaproteobacteria bacterium]|nr:hypothetical protein [Alphaproteobacteria bacterium]
MLRTFLTLAALGGLYLLLSGQPSPHELAAAAGCAALGAAAAGLAVGPMKPGLSFAIEDLAPLGSALARLAGGSWRAARGLAAAAILGRGGGFERKRFVRGQKTSERDRTRRVICLIAESLTPDSYVVRFHPGRPEIDLHELPRGGKGGA